MTTKSMTTFLCAVLLAGTLLGGCQQVDNALKTGSRMLAMPERPPAIITPERRSRYLIVSLASHPLHPENTERIAEHVRQYLYHVEQSAVLDRDLNLNEDELKEFRARFDRYFRSPNRVEIPDMQSSLKSFEPDGIVILMLHRYGQYWNGDRMEKRVDLEALYAERDDPVGTLKVVSASTVMLDRHRAFSDVEEKAAKKIFETLWSMVYPTLTPTSTDTPLPTETPRNPRKRKSVPTPESDSPPAIPQPAREAYGI